jgi:TonB family protein
MVTRILLPLILLSIHLPALHAQEVRYFDRLFNSVEQKKTNNERKYTIDLADSITKIEDFSSGQLQVSGTIYGLTDIEEVNNFIRYARNNAHIFHYKPYFKNVRGEFLILKSSGSPDCRFLVKHDTVRYAQVWDVQGDELLVNGSGQRKTIISFGNRVGTEIYVDSLLDSRFTIRSLEGDTIYSKVDKPAEPKEGIQAFGQQLSKKIQYPVLAQMGGKEGVVFINFIVEKNGQLTGFRPVKSDGSTFEQKTIKNLERLAPWNPAEFKGKKVKTEYTLPVRFKLEQ